MDRHFSLRGSSSRHCVFSLAVAVAVLGAWSGAAQAQEDTRGSVSGRVTLATNGDAVHGARVLVLGTGRSAGTDADGRYTIKGVPAGTWSVVAQREHLAAERLSITVEPGRDSPADFALEISPVHEEITVTASAGESTAFEAFSSVTSLDSFALAETMGGTLGDVLEQEPGVAERSFGPGSSRPIIRGFDGDRVLVMEDGVRTGDLGSQSGDHGVSVDPASLERIEILKGPVTLLYGGNAVGGVVNTITPQDRFKTSPPEDLRGQVTADGGTANRQAGFNGALQYGRDGWAVWGGGGARRAGDYATPEGRVANSATRLANAHAGVGFFGEKAHVGLAYKLEDGRYGIPFAGEFHGHADEGGEHGEEEELLIDLDQRRTALRLDFGVRELGGFFDSVQAVASRLDWRHNEIEIDAGTETLGTRFDNESWVLRATARQRPRGRLSGQVGVAAHFRDYAARGAEALAPPVTQDTFAAFALEELNFGRVRVQLGARVERDGYTAAERPQADEDGHGRGDEPAPPEARGRSFTGASGSLGLHVDVGGGSAVVANLTRSHRAPALEELYNFGPHVGNLAFEIGSPDLVSESSAGLDLSLRHQSRRAKLEAGFFYYDISNFVFPSFTGEERDGLRVAEFLQGDARFFGFDARASLELHEHLWLHASAGLVDADLTSTDEALPRIPPLHGRLGLEVPYKGVTLKPELQWAARQDSVFRGEIETAGYTVFNVTASYVLPQRHAAHIFSVKAYNLCNRLWRNHTSFIKDLAPELGRGVRFTYTLRFF